MSLVTSHSGTARDLRREPIIALIGDGLYSVMTETSTIGFIHKVGNVYVALGGENANHAVELGQSLSWEQALHMVRFG